MEHGERGLAELRRQRSKFRGLRQLEFEKPPKCPSVDEWIRKIRYIYTVEYYSAIKKRISCRL